MIAEHVDGEYGTVTPWDSSRKSPQALAKTTNLGVTNRIRVTVTYQWVPGVLIPGSLNMTSVSEVPILN